MSLRTFVPSENRTAPLFDPFIKDSMGAGRGFGSRMCRPATGMTLGGSGSGTSNDGWVLTKASAVLFSKSNVDGMFEPNLAAVISSSLGMST